MAVWNQLQMFCMFHMLFACRGVMVVQPRASLVATDAAWACKTL